MNLFKKIKFLRRGGDFDLDNSLLSVWTKALKEEYLLDAFGNLPGAILSVYSQKPY
ncbi:MAG: hypothetical protein WBQ25_00755 [Nitrososphaeraceae archaeon]